MYSGDPKCSFYTYKRYYLAVSTGGLARIATRTSIFVIRRDSREAHSIMAWWLGIDSEG